MNRFDSDNPDTRGFQMDQEESKAKTPRQGTKRRLSAQVSEDKGEDIAGRKKSRNYLDTHKNIEKRRRDRINNCLNTLKTLVPECRAYSMSAYAAKKLDKAEILEMTIDYLHKVQQVHPGGLLNDPRMHFEAEQWVNELSHWVQQEKQCQNNVGDFVHSLLNHLQTYKTRSRFESILHNGIKAEPMTPPWNRPCSFNFPSIHQADDSSDDMLDDSESIIREDSPSGEQAMAESRRTSNPVAYPGGKPQGIPEPGMPEHFTPSVADFIKSLSQRNNASSRPTSLPHPPTREFSKTSPIPPLISPNDCNGASCGTPNHAPQFRFPSPFQNNHQHQSCGCSCGGNQTGSASCAHENCHQPTSVYPSTNPPTSSGPSSAQSAAMTIQNLQHFITQQLNLPGASQALLNSWATITSNLVSQTLQQNPQHNQQQQRQTHYNDRQHHNQQHQHFNSQYQQPNHLHHYDLQQQQLQQSPYSHHGHQQSQERSLQNHPQHNNQNSQQRIPHHQHDQQPHNYRPQQEPLSHNHHHHHHHNHHHQQQQQQQQQNHHHHQQQQPQQQQQQQRRINLRSSSPLQQTNQHFCMDEDQRHYETLGPPCNGTKITSPMNIDMTRSDAETELPSPEQVDDPSTGGEESGEGVDQGILGDENHQSSMSSASFADLIKALETNAWTNSGVHGNDEDDTGSLLDGAPTLHDLPICLPVHE
ncbi:uncharacterized protein [Ptychodera flava]|uniref:uncharacterized protein isoform X2 n=1 Tax=Ptychodera flava TaxID=63121 RepID=UPI00396A9F0D